MAQVINTNILSQVAQNNLNKSQSKLSTAIERLSSGLRINSAKDDAAGMAIANRFQANITGLTQASRNANDGISLSQTTESAVSKINERVQNIRRLTEQALNGTNSAADRNSLQDEINQDLEEINRISEQTDFNGIKVLSKDQTVTIQVGAKDGEVLELSLKELNAESLGLNDFSVVGGVNPSKLDEATGTITIGKNAVSAKTVTDTNTTTTAFTEVVKVTPQAGGESKFYAKFADGKYSEVTTKPDGTATYNSSSKGDLPAGSKVESVKTLDVTMDSSKLTGLDANDKLKKYTDESGNVNYVIESAVDGETKYFAANFDKNGKVSKGAEQMVIDKDATDKPLAKLDAALSQIDGLRSALGAMHSRFESVISNLDSTTINLSAAQSRIQDADYAQEAAKMGAANITMQSGMAVLVQANQVPQMVLSLLR